METSAFGNNGCVFKSLRREDKRLQKLIWSALGLRVEESFVEMWHWWWYSVFNVSLRTGVSGKNVVEQSPQYLSVQEGETVAINCSYSEGMTTLHWMQQNPGRGLVTLFILSLEMKKKGRITVTINTEERHSSLLITASQLRDSAIYFCGVETQCTPNIWNPYSNPKLET